MFWTAINIGFGVIIFGIHRGDVGSGIISYRVVTCKNCLSQISMIQSHFQGKVQEKGGYSGLRYTLNN